MAKNYYGHFQKFLSDTTIDDLIKTTMGYKESSTGINAVNEWVKQNTKSDADFMEFDTIFSSFLTANEALWFNLSWHIGWAAGVVQGLKAQGLDIPESTSCLAAVYNEVRHAGRIFQGGCSNG
jgi:hypothetical protein